MLFACVGATTATCSDCDGGTCPNPVLPDVVKEKKLTSGYMGIISANKPQGTNDKHISETYSRLELVHCVLLPQEGNQLPQHVNIQKVNIYMRRLLPIYY